MVEFDPKKFVKLDHMEGGHLSTPSLPIEESISKNGNQKSKNQKYQEIKQSISEEALPREQQRQGHGQSHEPNQGHRAR